MNAWIDDWLGPFVTELGIWSLQWAILIAGILIWFAVRPPRTASVRSLVARMVLLAGGVIPFVPQLWGPRWVERDSLTAIAGATSEGATVAQRNNRRPVLRTLLVKSDFVRDEELQASTIPSDRESAASEAQETADISSSAAEVPPEALGWKRIGLIILASSWSTGTLLWLGRWVAGVVALRRLRRGALPVEPHLQYELDRCRYELGVTRLCSLGTHPTVNAPLLAGGTAPWILVPPVWPQLSLESRRAILLHELAHLQRYDDLFRILEELILAPFFFHPFVHWLVHRINVEREELCDASIIENGIAPRDLARVLIDLCRECGIGRPLLAADRVSLRFLRQPSVKDRIQSLMEENNMSRWIIRPGWRSTVGTGAGICLALTLVAGFGVRAEDAPVAAGTSKEANPAPARDPKQEVASDTPAIVVDFSAFVDLDQLENMPEHGSLEVKGFGRFTIEQLAWSCMERKADNAIADKAIYARLLDVAGNPLRPTTKLPATARVTALSHNGDAMFPKGESVLANAKAEFPVIPHSDYQEGKPVSIQVQLAGGPSFEVHFVPSTGKFADALGKTIDVHLPTHLHPKVVPPQEVAADELAGVVVDEKGEPLEGVVVEFMDGECCGTEELKTVTDRMGLFRIPGFRAVIGNDESSEVMIRFRKPGYSPERFLLQPLGVKGWVVALGKTSFEGIVRGPDGKPAAGAVIRANQGPKMLSGGIADQLWTETIADDAGRYRLFVQPDDYELIVRAPGVGTTRLPKQPISFGEHRPLDIDLTPGVKFVARVVDSETNLPVPNVRLWHWMHRGLEGRSDDDGNVVILDMHPGIFEFDLESSTHTRWWSEHASEEWDRREVLKPGETWQRNFDGIHFDLRAGMEPVTIVAEKGVRIRGRIVDPDGLPVAGATAAPALKGTENSLTGDTRFSVESAADGTFVMLLPASHDAQYNLLAHDGKYGQWRNWANGVRHPIRTKPGDEINDVELKLTRPATVRGKVVNSEGNPVAGWKLTAHPEDKLEQRYYFATTQTAADGTFELPFIRPGKQTIRFEHESESVGHAFFLTPGQVVSDFEMTVPVAKPSSDVDGFIPAGAVPPAQ